MDLTAYLTYFQSVLSSAAHQPPYDDPDYIQYASLNWFRHQRWLKTGKLDPALISLLEGIGSPQRWIFITEPWCGDAAHTLPFIIRLLRLNSNITLDIQCRDTAPFLIDRYLTGSSRSIPKLIIRNTAEDDLLVWGPRPQKCQELYQQLKLEDTEYEQIHVDLQNWYNADKGVSFQTELLAGLTAVAEGKGW